MVAIATRRGRCRRRGSLLLELTVAVGILMYVFGSFAASFLHEVKLGKACYWRAVALHIVDGEMEALLAGELAAYAEGAHDYEIRADAAANLPPSTFVLTRKGKRLTLEWRPDRPGRGGPVRREVVLP